MTINFNARSESSEQAPGMLRAWTGMPGMTIIFTLTLSVFLSFSGGAQAGEASSDPHVEAYAKSQFPSAKVCAGCHKKIYKEWSSSAHAYSSVSPMFSKFEQLISNLTQGTLGSFCMRCHSTVATIFEEPRELVLWDRPQVSQEGITCVTCHRVNEHYGRSSGERRLVPGDIFSPVYGPFEGDGVEEVIENKSFFKVKTSEDEKGLGKRIHAKAIKFEQIDKSEFCVACHQVAVAPGIKLEVVWDQFRASPARKEGTTCQDCHMGKVPGLNKGYEKGPAAQFIGKSVKEDRRHSNHAFYGPGYSMAHPGVFPQNPKNAEFAMKDWLSYDYRAGWGRDKFETAVNDGKIKVDFPKVWADVEDRYTARDIIEENLEAIKAEGKLRKQLMSNGSHIDGPFFSGKPTEGEALKFKYRVKNMNKGHNMPSGSLGMQPQLWLNVALIDPNGRRIWESGYLDSNGDLADQHSLDVLAGKIERDAQLFNLQTKFLTTNVKGTDREMYLPVNFDIDQRPFIRPDGRPNTVMNHPPFIRMEARSIPPLGTKEAEYKVPAALMKLPGKYRLALRLRHRSEPVYFMKFIGATDEMLKNVNERMIDVHSYTVEFDVK